MSQSKISMSPTKFRATLIIIIALVLSLGVFGFYTAQATLSSYAEEVKAKVSEAEASKNSVDQLKRLQLELERLEDARKRANSIAAESQSYNYQNQIIADLNRFAGQAGVTLTRFDFQASGASTQSTATPSRASPASPRPASGGLSSTTVNVTISSPVSYTNLLRFLRAIEQNLTKMQISGVSLSPGSDSNTVSTDSLNIEVYIK